MEGEQYDVVPPLDQLDRRVRRYRVTFADPMHFLVRDEGSFGDTSEAAALRIVESIPGNPDRQRLLVADEYTSDEGGRPPSNMPESTFHANPTGRDHPAGQTGRAPCRARGGRDSENSGGS